PEAEHLVRSGLCEGPPNVHPGQGTANRRFFFANSMLELLWVENSAEAQNEVTAPTQLWERWTNRGAGACPFRGSTPPVRSDSIALPFPAQKYQPIWLPPELRIYVSPASVTEPMWLYMPFLRRTDHERRFMGHPSGVRKITGWHWRLRCRRNLLPLRPCQREALFRINKDRTISSQSSLITVCAGKRPISAPTCLWSFVSERSDAVTTPRPANGD